MRAYISHLWLSQALARRTSYIIDHHCPAHRWCTTQDGERKHKRLELIGRKNIALKVCNFRNVTVPILHLLMLTDTFVPVFVPQYPTVLVHRAMVLD